MNTLEKRLETLANRKGLQEVGVVQSYPAEWDLVPYLKVYLEGVNRCMANLITNDAELKLITTHLV